MKTSILALLSLALLCTATDYAGPQHGWACTDLKTRFPSQVLLPGTETYTSANSGYYDQGAVLSPRCIFLPSTTAEVAAAVKVFARWDATFAVKGGGHMPIPGASNIHGGVLVAMDNLDAMSWSGDGTVLKTGAGQRWGAVYAKAAERGKVVVGGRIDNVGVPGLLLGGGVSYLGNERGMACDNVKGFEVVLADGRVVYASRSSHLELFKALKGGSSNFGIVTRFDLIIYDLSVGWGTTHVVPLNIPDAPLKLPAMTAAANYITDGAKSNVKTGVIITKALSPAANMDVVVFSLWSSTPERPPVFDEILSLPGQNLFNGTMPFARYVTMTGAVGGSGPPMRNSFRTASMVATKAGILKAEETWADSFEPLKGLAGFTQISSYQPITESQIRAGVARGGNVLGFDERVDQATFVWVISGVTWSNAEDDAVVLRTQEEALERIKTYAAERGILDPFIYMNDAAGGQEVIGSYGMNNVRFLRSVQRTYDPAGVFTRLLPGGFKIPGY